MPHLFNVGGVVVGYLAEFLAADWFLYVNQQMATEDSNIADDTDSDAKMEDVVEERREEEEEEDDDEEEAGESAVNLTLCSAEVMAINNSSEVRRGEEEDDDDEEAMMPPPVLLRRWVVVMSVSMSTFYHTLWNINAYIKFAGSYQ